MTVTVDCKTASGAQLRWDVDAPARASLSGVDCNVRLSLQTAVGWPFRPPHSRKSERTSSTSSSKQPAFHHRCICCYTTHQGPNSGGRKRHCPPVRAT